MAGGLFGHTLDEVQKQLKRNSACGDAGQKHGPTRVHPTVLLPFETKMDFLMRHMKTMIKSFFVASTFAATAPVYADIAASAPPSVDWDTTINHFQVDAEKFVGQRLTVSCPEHTRANAIPTVYGSGLYTSDSSICGAAAHVGAVSLTGGEVTLQIMPGATAYDGSERNELTSLSRPETERAIAFVTERSTDLSNVRQEYIPRLDWDTKFTRTGLANRDLVGQSFTFACPAAPSDMRPRRVVGTDRYAFDSMICRAAVHAGHLDLDGGSITLRMESGSKDLIGSKRHGIETKDGGSVVRTIVFVKD